jgi:N-acetylglutamate synthase-like GNAT family acetyltransferase
MRPTIRDASPFDIPIILDMLRSYRRLTPLPFLAEADDAEYVTKMLTELMAGKGIVLIADKDGIVGMLIAVIAPSMWSPKHMMMTEMAYWVEPDCRGGTMGYRLLAEYKKRGDELKKNGRICNYLISKMSNSPNLQYQKFGFEKLEEFWVA